MILLFVYDLILFFIFVGINFATFEDNWRIFRMRPFVQSDLFIFVGIYPIIVM